MDLATQAKLNGFNVLVMNALGPAEGDVKELESCDFSDNSLISQAIEQIKINFGKDSEIYACGYSLGSNYLLRHLATHE